MSAVFAITTIATYVVLCVYSTAGLRRVTLGPSEKYGEVLSGAFIALVGIAFLGLAGSIAIFLGAPWGLALLAPLTKPASGLGHLVTIPRAFHYEVDRRCWSDSGSTDMPAIAVHLGHLGARYDTELEKNFRWMDDDHLSLSRAPRA